MVLFQGRSQQLKLSNIPVQLSSPLKPSAQTHSGSPLKFWHTLFPVQGGSQVNTSIAEDKKSKALDATLSTRPTRRASTHFFHIGEFMDPMSLNRERGVVRWHEVYTLMGSSWHDSIWSVRAISDSSGASRKMYQETVTVNRIDLNDVVL